MKRKVAKLKPSPNEEARIIREERERRRKLRILQVREQQRHIALQIRREVEQRRLHELEQLEGELRVDWERQQTEKLRTLQRLYQESLQLLGQGHRSAKENEPNLAAIAQREEENHVKAEKRHQEALKELKSQRLKDHEQQSRAINSRKKALQAEKERSAKVASLPPPIPNPIQSVNPKKPHVVKKSDVNAFAATHYHMLGSTVDREADTQQPNAREGAELEMRRLQDLQREEMRRTEELLEKARQRGKEALRREHLVQDRERLLVELEHLQQTDLLRRRQQVSQMPPQIFQPLYKRQETNEDFQREMEFAFEDMYTGERRVKGDLVVQLVPEPLPALSTGSQDEELDVTMDEIATQETQGTSQHDTEQETSAQVEPSKPAPRRALKKLLDRIRNQRSHWIDHNTRVLATDSPTVITDQLPERDTTIDTGSLSSGEKDNLPPEEPPEPAHLAPVLETTEQSRAADCPPVLANRIQKFEEERKKREEELDREKQQQLVLLQELEEQKAKLEQMLLEAQQEREDLKAVMMQDEPIIHPEEPVHDEEVTSVGPVMELVAPAGEEDHARRIKEYQQRLLEQNRIHQRSVEVARQRLEEYQRALQIRRNMAVSSSLPAVMPPGFIHPYLHSGQPAGLPAPLQHPAAPAEPVYVHAKPQPPVEVPTRESDMLASPSPLPGSSAKLVPEEAESVLSFPCNGRPGAWLKEHLTDRVRPSSEPPPDELFTTHRSASTPLQPASYPSLSTRDNARLIPGRSTVKPGPSPHGSLRTGSVSSKEGDNTDAQRRELELRDAQRRELELRDAQRRELELRDAQRRELELRDAQRLILEQREAVALQLRQREEDRQRQEVELEHMRHQKETLQALIHTDAQPAPEAAEEVLVSENINQTRLKLLASLLRAIEESNGGSLSHLEDPEEKGGFPPQPLCDSGEKDLVPQNDDPVRPATASVLPSGLYPPPPRAAKPPVTRVKLGIMGIMTEQHELSAIQEVETPVNASQVTDPEDIKTVPFHNLDLDSESSVASDRTLQTPSWSSSGLTAERSSGSGTSSRSSSSLIWRERLLMGAGTSPESSESGSFLRRTSPPSSDSGRGADYSGPAVTSYRSPTESICRPPDSDCLSSTTISTGSYITTDPEQNVNTDNSPSLRVRQGQDAEILDVPCPSGQSLCIEDSLSTGCPALAVDSLFNDSSIQQIIDRYTRELNISLSTAGKTTDSEGSHMEEPGASVSQHSLDPVETRGEGGSSSTHQAPLSDTAGSQRSSLERPNTVHPILEHFSAEDPSLTEDQEQDSFRPLIGQLTDQSSCLAFEQRDSAMEQLVGQPSAHSSMIGQLPRPAVSVSFDQGGWDSTLNRMIGRLSHQSSSHWLSGGQDFYTGQLMGQSASWLEGSPEENRMRPLIGELDESVGQPSGSSGERTHVDLGVSTEASVPSYPALPPEASSHSASVQDVNPHPQGHTLQSQTSPMHLDPERTEESFHPLLAEITHNETADPSMTFHLPEHNVPTSPEGRPAEVSYSDPSVEPSPEHFRAEGVFSCVAASPTLQDSFSHLLFSQSRPHESDVELTALNLSRLTLCDDVPAVGISLPEGADTDKHCSDNIKLEAASEKGILEQSEITLVSLSDTTLEDQEKTVTEEEGLWKDERPHGGREEGQRDQETEAAESILSQHETPEDKDQRHPDSAMLLEFQWGPNGGQQEVHKQKRRALLQRSSSRVEEIKARLALAKVQPATHPPSEARERSKDKKAQDKINTKSKAELLQTTEKSDFIKPKKPQLPPSVSNSKLMKVEVRSCTPEQRKQDVSEMHQRTRRLYEQLEEVKHQKAIRNRQEASAKNRLKAKEFHQKTLQKLRAKQTLS